MKRADYEESIAQFNALRAELAQLEQSAEGRPESQRYTAQMRTEQLLRQISILDDTLWYEDRNQIRREAGRMRKAIKPGDIRCEACQWVCRARYASRVMHLHHIIPVSREGTNDSQNLMMLCPSCHSLFHAAMAVDGIAPQNRDELFDLIRKRPAYPAETDPLTTLNSAEICPE